MGIKSAVLEGFLNTIKSDKRSMYYILYYSLLESILALSLPLTSSFIINSLIAHASISVVVLGSIILFIFMSITFLKLMQEYIIEKFEQRVFVDKGFEVAQKAYALKEKNISTKYPIDKLMNYFFDITTIQKIFPVFILNGAGLIMQILVSLILLFIFSAFLFYGALAILVIYFTMLILLGNNGIDYAIKRSDMKHNAIYFLQKIPTTTDSKEKTLEKVDEIMGGYVNARKNHFKVVFKQLALSYIVQGVIISSFFIFGGYLVINGELPVGEFIAAEILIVSLIYALNGFIKQLDYIYDGIEGYYKIGKLSASLDIEEKNSEV
ncbi:ABC transporter ATP-binding protein [Candidatus Sulfurimonas marisnigri]|uniref:ABC transporter ATP-binding protein n=1 Tax=Candidatus Sulfurimonas marisnigri TaxID=2740405 RepID=A0A7S7LYG3_9BACT|nr:ABC transporter ATP-binding protein [Candidatus Sulfurimonas marisnigri]QOY53769.1 ABC transporter ATP-binding protein [Candidatus Sulfurimonas marisnigri]